MSSFSNLKLSKQQLDNLNSLGYVVMTPIQEKVLPLSLEGKDIIAKAKTGSGKTVAFGLPILAKLQVSKFSPQGLVLCPTRELANQVATEIRRLARHQQNIKIVILCGGKSIGTQIASLKYGAHVVIGTPGRIQDHLRKKTLDLREISMVVLDEADRMLEMGFVDQIKSIVKVTPNSRQTVLFSATYPDNIKRLSSRFQISPSVISIEALPDSHQLEQFFFLCAHHEKLSGLKIVLEHYRPASVLIFCQTKKTTARVLSYLQDNGIAVKSLHGDLEQRDRDQVLIQFGNRSCRILVATDVAARGLDIDKLPMVINFDLPSDAESYVHRIGRTGRSTNHGLAISLLTDKESYKLDTIRAFLDRSLDIEVIESLAYVGEIPQSEFITLYISGGRKQKIRPGDVLGALTSDSRIDAKTIGRIDVTDYATFVAVERLYVSLALDQIRNGKIKGRMFKVRSLL
ncbi:MAG: ATP-dependent RNA helicase DbpA [Gammaproteobacteria bacterium]|nr:ATP-dependent RNA helicase DbpA [Gammaproteobacteria bacterium]